MHTTPQTPRPQQSRCQNQWRRWLLVGILLCLLIGQNTPLPVMAQSKLPTTVQPAKVKRAAQGVETYVKEGAALLDADDYEGALAALEQALALDPNHARAYALRGQVYWLMDELDLALADLNQALDLDPANADAYGTRGAVLAELERYAEAIGDYDQALTLTPDDNWALAHRGYTYYLADQYDEALVDLDQALKRNPNYTWAIVVRGNTYRNAWRLYKSAPRSDPCDQLGPQL